MGIRVAFLFAAVVAIGCGDDVAAPMPDAGGDSGGMDAGSPIVMPPMPANVSLLPCPDGWRQVFGRDDVIHCEPFDIDGWDDFCLNAEVHLPGRPGCEPLGTECPGTEFPQSLPPDAMVRFVRPGGSGDGSRSSPFGSIRDALASATDGMVIALAAGEYVESLVIDKSVELRGVCALETSIQPDGTTIVNVEDATVGLTDLRIGFGSAPGLIVGAGGIASLSGVEVRGTRSVGIAVGTGGMLTADGLHVISVSPDAGGRFGRGISVEGTGTATIRRVVIEEVEEAAVFSSGTLTIEDAVITGRRDPFFPGVAPTVRLESGGDLTLRRSLVRESPREGVSVSVSTVRLEDVVIRGTDGEALRLSMSAAELVRVHTDDGAWPVLALDASTVTVDGWLAANAFVQGIVGTNGTRISGRGIAVRDVAGVGLILTGAGSTLDVEDLSIHATQPDEVGAVGRGLNIQQGATATVRRANIIGNRDAAVFVSGTGTTLDVSDLSVADTSSRAVDGRGGAGVLAQSQAQVTLTRARISTSRGHGLMALGDGTILIATELTVEDIQPQLCAQSDCSEEGRGIGVGSYAGAHVDAAGFSLRELALCGVIIAGDAELDLARGAIVNTEIGLCVSVPDYDFDRLNEQVSIRDVERRVDAPMLPLPDPEPPVTAP